MKTTVQTIGSVEVQPQTLKQIRNTPGIYKPSTSRTGRVIVQTSNSMFYVGDHDRFEALDEEAWNGITFQPVQEEIVVKFKS